MAVAKTADGFTLKGGDNLGLRLTRTYSFSPDKYLVKMLVSIENNGESPRPVSWEMTLGPGIDRHLPEKEKTDEGLKIFAAGALDDVAVKKVGERKDLGPVTWAAVGNRYFLAALLPVEGSLSAFARRTTTAGEEIGLRSEVASLGPRQSVTYRIEAYLGPKDRTLLTSVGKELERLVKGFGKADEERSAGLDQLLPFLERASEQRRAEQTLTLDRLFELRDSLTPEEWANLLERLE